MPKRMKVLLSVLVAILLLTVGGTAIALAQEEEEPTPQVEANGLLARVAEILGMSEEDLIDAFKQARQEMMEERWEEAFYRALDKAVEEGLLTQEEADEIREWWEEKPEALNLGLLRRVFGLVGPDAKNLPNNGRGKHLELGLPWVGEWQRPGPPPWVEQQRQRPGPPPWVGQLQPGSTD